MISGFHQLTQDNLSEGIINQLNRIMHCIRLEVHHSEHFILILLQYPHFIVTAPPPMQTLVNMYEGHYLAAAASEVWNFSLLQDITIS